MNVRGKRKLKNGKIGVILGEEMVLGNGKFLHL